MEQLLSVNQAAELLGTTVRFLGASSRSVESASSTSAAMSASHCPHSRT